MVGGDGPHRETAATEHQHVTLRHSLLQLHVGVGFHDGFNVALVDLAFLLQLHREHLVTVDEVFHFIFLADHFHKVASCNDLQLGKQRLNLVQVSVVRPVKVFQVDVFYLEYLFCHFCS